jgi:hypothetical protein
MLNHLFSPKNSERQSAPRFVEFFVHLLFKDNFFISRKDAINAKFLLLMLNA